MSVSAASQTSRPQPTSRTSHSHGRQVQPGDEDVQAMKQAFANARQQGLGQAPRLPVSAETAKKDALDRLAGDGDAKADDAALVDLDSRQQVLRDDGNQDQNGAQGWAFGQALADAPMIVPNAPSPSVDPGAFAQLMSQLWAQAKQKGEREVRVRFGTNAWPATGATLVRNAAGSLDIALQLAAGQHADLDALGTQLSGSGVAVGSLVSEADLV
jgi:hypothetical protein